MKGLIAGLRQSLLNEIVVRIVSRLLAAFAFAILVVLAAGILLAAAYLEKVHAVSQVLDTYLLIVGGLAGFAVLLTVGYIVSDLVATIRWSIRNYYVQEVMINRNHMYDTEFQHNRYSKWRILRQYRKAHGPRD